MFDISAVSPKRLFVWLCIAALTACGDGGGDVTDQQSLFAFDESYEITGAGIKGPLAYANVSIYTLDTNFDGLYDPSKPVATATTNAYAEIKGLKVRPNGPPNSRAPYVLVIDGANAIDLNTNTAPVINKLVSIITSESLNAKQPVYATPYTTLAYHMLRQDNPRSGGNGLQARYYNDLTFSNLAMERVDAQINFSWGGGSPDGLVNNDNFSVQWSGFIEPDFSETYTFHTSTDDGVRLWIDGQLIVDQWHDQSETEHSGTIHLNTGTRYPVVMEYYENAGGAAAKLSWSSASQAKSIVPEANLYTNLFTEDPGSERGTDPLLATRLPSFNQEIIETLGFGISMETNIFTTPPIITKDTITIEQQQLVVNYRAAIEALSSLLYEISLAASDTTADAMLQKLALDLYTDGRVDGQPSGIDPQILYRDPMIVDIANTPYQVQDIISLMDEERALTGSGGNVIFLKDSISVNLQSIDMSSNSAPTQSTDNNVVTEPAETGTSVGNSVSSGTVTEPTETGTSVGNSVSSGTAVLYADFENRGQGAYQESDIRSDFRIGQDGYSDTVHGPDWGTLDIVQDPAASGRGNVMRCLHSEGISGFSNGAGFRWRADLPPADEYYFAYDYYVSSDWWQPLQHKMPGLINGTLRDASHDAGVIPDPDTLVAFSARMQSHSDSAFGRGDGSLAGYYYDKDQTQRYDWLNTIDPTSKANVGQYLIPRGQWITIEQRLKVNTPGIKDGVLQIWVNGQLVSDQLHKWRIDDNLRVDGIFMSSFYGGNVSDSRNQAPKDQYQYYDNFIVSNSPITH